MNNARDSFALRRANARRKLQNSGLPIKDTLIQLIEYMGASTQYSCSWVSEATIAKNLKKSANAIQWHIRAIKALGVLETRMLEPDEAERYIKHKYPDATLKFGNSKYRVSVYQPNLDHPLWNGTKSLPADLLSEMNATIQKEWTKRQSPAVRQRKEQGLTEKHNTHVNERLNTHVNAGQSVKTFNSIEDDCSNLSHHWKGKAPNLKTADAASTGQGYAPQSRLASQLQETSTSQSNQPLETSAGQNFKEEVLPFNRRNLKSSEESQDTTQDLEAKERQERKQKYLEQVNSSPRYQEFLSLLSIACGPLTDSHVNGARIVQRLTGVGRSTEKRGAHNPIRGFVAKTCDGRFVTSPTIREEYECTTTWTNGPKSVAWC